MAEQLSKVYDPKAVEEQINKLWQSGPYFHAEPSRDGQKRTPFTIVIPPPNVTAALHLGHALNNTLQDILIRCRRMQQHDTLWMPGTDHAGIATQTVVEKRILAEEGKRRTDFRARGVRRPHPGMEGRVRGDDPRPAQGDGLLVRLAAHALHDGRGLRQGGPGDVLQALRGRPDLPRQAAGQLGPGHADRAGRRRGRARDRPGPLLVPAVSACRARDDRRQDASSMSPSPRPGRRPCWATRPWR